MIKKKQDLFYFMLPLFLWPISFILLQNIFVYALTASSLILAFLTLRKYRVHWFRIKNKTLAIAAGILTSLILYAIFFLGRQYSNAFGMSSLVNSVYSSIYGNQGASAILIVLLAFIGICEEIYWRGGIQGYLEVNSKVFRSFPWIASSFYYAFVHVSTLNPILVGAALAVGLITGITAQRFGVVASAITHVAWIEMIVVFFPV